jgi:hypothetical protein
LIGRNLERANDVGGVKGMQSPHFGLVLLVAGTAASLYLVARRIRSTPVNVGLVGGLSIPLCLYAFVALNAIDGLTGQMHTGGDESYPLSQATSPSELWGWRDTPTDDVVDQWGRWHDVAEKVSPQPVGEPLNAVWHYLVLDSAVFVPAYAALLWILLVPGSAWLEAKTGQPSLVGKRQIETFADAAMATAHRRRARIPILLIGVVVAADWIENASTWAVIESGSASGPVVAILNIATSVKWLGAGFLLAWSVAVSIPILEAVARDGRLRSIISTLATLRAQIVVVVMFGVLLLLSPTLDVMRRWRGGLLVVNMAVLLLFTLTTWASARKVVDARARIVDPRPSVKPLQVTVVGALLFAIGILSMGMMGAPRGLAVAGAIATVVGLLSMPKGDNLAPRKLRHVSTVDSFGGTANVAFGS